MNKIKNRIKYIVGLYSIKIVIYAYNLKGKGQLGNIVYKTVVCLLRMANMAVFPVVNTLKYRDILGNAEITEVENNRVGTYASIVMAGNDIPSVLKYKAIPDVRLNKFSNVYIRGNSDVVIDLKNSYVISNSAYNISDKEEIIDGLLYRTRNNLCLLRDNCLHGKIKYDAGVMISGKFCFNYYHVIYENLIRMLYISNDNIPIDVPIIIDKKTYDIPSFRRVIDILNMGINRKILLIDANSMYQFDVLYTIDRINILPSHSVSPDANDLSFLYSQSALLKMRDRLIKYKSSCSFAKRIFITRASSKNRRYNEQEVFNILESFGFKQYAPEQMSFDEQMALFNSAEYIVTGSGAALSNLLFVNNSCTIVCFGLSTNDNVRDVPVFNTIAKLNGANFLFFPRVKNRSRAIHANYKIDCDQFKEFMGSLIAK